MDENKEWFCPNCGTKNTGNFCVSCGTKAPEQVEQPQAKPEVQQETQPASQPVVQPVNVYVQQTAPQQTAQPEMKPGKMNAMAIVGFVFSFFIGLLGLIFSCVGSGQIKRARAQGIDEKGKGFATAGIIISIISMIWQVIWIITSIAAAIGAIISQID